jgi:1,4-dihydroxy-6-naphthoate synthase
MKLTLGISPCPNDTFIFEAMINHKIDTEGIELDVQLEDVQTLNQWALQGKLDVTKISYGVLPLLQKNYTLLDSGGALGKGVGPLLIAKKQIDHSEVSSCTIAIPGENTTANLLFSLAFPDAKNKQYLLFSEIENAVLNGDVDCGVIIHENRFTYQQKGLVKLMDLGTNWEEKMNCPIPLGGIVMKKTFDEETCEKVNRVIKRSLEYAFARYPSLPDYVKQHSQEMEENVMRQHIELYVNDYSLSLGENGRKAVSTLLEVYERNHQPASIS